MNMLETKFDRSSPDYEMWAHAGCLTLAEGNKDYPPEELQSAAMKAVIQVVQERDALKAENARLNKDLLAEQLRWTNTRIELVKLSSAVLNMVNELVYIARSLPTSNNISLFGVIDRLRRAGEASENFDNNQ